MKGLMYSIGLFVGRLLAAIAVAVVAVILLSACLMFVWNLAIVPTFGAPELTILGAFGIIAVPSIVFNGSRFSFNNDKYGNK